MENTHLPEGYADALMNAYPPRVDRMTTEPNKIRVSFDKEDPGYSPFAHYCAATLDGFEQNLASAADEIQGLIVRYVADENGKVIVEDGVAKRETITGTVVITLRENVPSVVKEWWAKVRGTV